MGGAVYATGAPMKSVKFSRVMVITSAPGYAVMNSCRAAGRTWPCHLNSYPNNRPARFSTQSSFFWSYVRQK